MGRIHRYGQEKDCLIFNFVATNTREGRVLEKLFERLEQIESDLDPAPARSSTSWARCSRRTCWRSCSARCTPATRPRRASRSASSSEVDPSASAHHRLDAGGLAKRSSTSRPIVGKSAEAKERRLVPEVIEDFFVVYRVGKVPKTLVRVGERTGAPLRPPRQEYQRVFDKVELGDDPTLEWVTPGHPLFEVVRADVRERVGRTSGAGRSSLTCTRHSPTASTCSVRPSRTGGATRCTGSSSSSAPTSTAPSSIRQPTLILDVIPAPKGTAAADGSKLFPDRQAVELELVESGAHSPSSTRSPSSDRENQVVRKHMEISLGELIHRQNMQLADLVSKQQAGDTTPGLAGNIAQAEQHLDELNRRLERRRDQLEMERHCTIGDILHLGPVRGCCRTPTAQPRASRPWSATRRSSASPSRRRPSYEEARGWVVESVESENRGFDLISRKPHPHDPATFTSPFHRGEGPRRRGRGRPEPTSTRPPSGSGGLLALRRLQLRRRPPSSTRSRTLRGSAGSPSCGWSTTTSGPKRSWGLADEY
jgi:hypothetical protein